MDDWLRESTRLFIEDILKEDLGLGPMMFNGNETVVTLSPTTPSEPNIIQRIKSACDNINLANLNRDETIKLEKILNYLEKIN